MAVNKNCDLSENEGENFDVDLYLRNRYSSLRSYLLTSALPTVSTVLVSVLLMLVLMMMVIDVQRRNFSNARRGKDGRREREKCARLHLK